VGEMMIPFFGMLFTTIVYWAFGFKHVKRMEEKKNDHKD